MSFDGNNTSGGWMDLQPTPGSNWTHSKPNSSSVRRQSTWLDEDEREDGVPKAAKKYAPVFKRALKKLKVKKTSSVKGTKIIQLTDDSDDYGDNETNDVLLHSRRFSVCNSNQSAIPEDGWGGGVMDIMSHHNPNPLSHAQVADVPPSQPTPGSNWTHSEPNSSSVRRQSTCLDEDERDDDVPKAAKKYAPVFKRALKKLIVKKTSSVKGTSIIQLTDDSDDYGDNEANDVLLHSRRFSVCDSNQSAIPEDGWGGGAMDITSHHSPNPLSHTQVANVPPSQPSVQGWCNLDATKEPSIPSENNPKKPPLDKNISNGAKKGKKPKKRNVTKTTSDIGVMETGRSKGASSKFKLKRIGKQKKNVTESDSSEKTSDEVDVLAKGYDKYQSARPKHTEASKVVTGKIMNLHSVGWDSFENDQGTTDAVASKLNYSVRGHDNEDYLRSKNSLLRGCVETDEDMLSFLSDSSGSEEFPLHQSRSENTLDGDMSANRSCSLRKQRKCSVTVDSLSKSWNVRSFVANEGDGSDESSTNEIASRGLLKRMFSRKKRPEKEKITILPDAAGTVVVASNWKHNLGFKSTVKQERKRSNSIQSLVTSLSPSEESNNQTVMPKRDAHVNTFLMFQAQSPEGCSGRSSQTSHASHDVWSASPSSSHHSLHSLSNESAQTSSPKSTPKSSPKSSRRLSWFSGRNSTKKKDNDLHILDDEKPLNRRASDNKNMFIAAKVLLAAAKWKKKQPKVKHVVGVQDQDNGESTGFIRKDLLANKMMSLGVATEVDDLSGKWEENNLCGSTGSDDNRMENSDDESITPATNLPKVILSKALEETACHDDSVICENFNSSKRKNQRVSISSIGSNPADDFFVSFNVQRHPMAKLESRALSLTSVKTERSGSESQSEDTMPLMSDTASILQEPKSNSSMYSGSGADSDDEKKDGLPVRMKRPKESPVHEAFTRTSRAIARFPSCDATFDEDNSKSKQTLTVYGCDRCGDCLEDGSHHRRLSTMSTDTETDLLCLSCNSLQEELEAAKRRHLEEMEQKLERERSAAQQQHEQEVARKRKEAEAELQRQQQEYEQRLAELEKALWDQKAEQQETEQDRLRAQQRIRTLEREKETLESEVLLNMKKLEQDARASQKIMAESRHQHSRLVDQLERERHKIQKDVERIEQIRLRRGNTPSTPRFTPAKQPETGSENMYRFTLLLREANKISQYFKKSVAYSLEMVEQGDNPQTLIKVTNTKLEISTFWPRHKFEERLHHMRELFQSCDPESQSAELDDVFCDINDTWAKSDRGVSPKVLENLKKPRLRGRLSFDSLGSSVSSPREAVASPLVRGDSGKMGMSGNSAQNESILEMPTVSNLCRELISSALGRFTEATLQESVADKILLHCEVIKACITTTLEAFNQATEAGVQRSVFVESPSMRINSIQLTSHLEVLLSQSALWVGSYEALKSGLIRNLCNRIIATVRKLGSQLVLFLQGCENDLDTLVQESAGQALSSLFSLSKHCGELALATETSMMVLNAPTRGSTDSEEDMDLDIQVGHDVRQSFLSGCDVFIDKTLHGGLRTVEECEMRLQVFTDDMSQNMPSEVEAVAQQIALTAACAKTMLMHCQQLQVDFDSTLQETLMETKPEFYYGRSYERAQGLVSHITNLTDTVTHFTQASATYLQDSEPSALRKVARCAELIQKSSSQLLATSNSDPAVNTSASFSDSQQEASMLSESRRDQLEVAAQEVKDATNSLIATAKQRFDRGPIVSTPIKAKRMLPQSPVKTKEVLRRSSLTDRSEPLKAKVHALRKAFENAS